MVRSKTQTTLQSSIQPKPAPSTSSSAPIVLDGDDDENVKSHKPAKSPVKVKPASPKKSMSASPPRKSPSPKKTASPSPKRAKKATVVIDDDEDEEPYVPEKEEAHEAKSTEKPSGKNFKYLSFIPLGSFNYLVTASICSARMQCQLP